MTDTKYNGWTNYATWRVNMEMGFCDQPVDVIDDTTDAWGLGQYCRELTLEYVSEQASGLALDYAEAFLADVNWQEIAQHMIEEYANEREDA